MGETTAEPAPKASPIFPGGAVWDTLWALAPRREAGACDSATLPLAASAKPAPKFRRFMTCSLPV